MKLLTTALAVAILASACSDGRTSPTAPTPVPPLAAPSPPPAQPPVVTYYALSGMVFEITDAGRVPIEGVEVYCDTCGSPNGHTSVYTDPDGSYRLEFTANGMHPLFVTKSGYDFPADTARDRFGRVAVMVNGDTRFDVQLVRR